MARNAPAFQKLSLQHKLFLALTLPIMLIIVIGVMYGLQLADLQQSLADRQAPRVEYRETLRHDQAVSDQLMEEIETLLKHAQQTEFELREKIEYDLAKRLEQAESLSIDGKVELSNPREIVGSAREALQHYSQAFQQTTALSLRHLEKLQRLREDDRQKQERLWKMETQSGEEWLQRLRAAQLIMLAATLLVVIMSILVALFLSRQFSMWAQDTGTNSDPDESKP